MIKFTLHILNEYGYIGIFLLLVIETIFPPIPSGVILTFGGFMTTRTKLNVWLMILFATLGTMVGCMILYGFGRLVNADRLEKILEGRTGKILHLPPKKVQQAHAWFDRYGSIPVFAGRLIPVVRNLISIPAGMVKMPLDKFFWLSLLGTVIWNTVFIWLGVFAETGREVIFRYKNIYLVYGLLAVSLIVLIFAMIRYRRRILKNRLFKDKDWNS